MNSSVSEIARNWEQTLKIIKDRLNDPQTFDYFFDSTYIHDVQGDTVILVVKDMVSQRVLSSKYIDLIKEAFFDVTEEQCEFKFVLSSDIAKGNTQKGLNGKRIEEPTFFKDAFINETLTFDSFVEGEFNKEAYRAAKIVAQNPGKRYNPLFIYSNSGLGKTHLLHAIGNYVKKMKPDAKVLYIDANDFVDEYVKFAKGGESESLKDSFSDVDVILFDDVQFLKNKVKTEEMFFYIYQKMYNRQKQIVITSDRQPSELVGLEDRLITRFSQGLTVKINNPDVETCVKILEKEIVDKGFDISIFDPTVLYFYAEKFSNNVRELEGAFKRLIFYIDEHQPISKVDLDVAIKASQDLIGNSSVADQLSEQKIINVVSDYYGLTPSQLVGKTRTGQIALARHIAMYLIRINIDVPLTKIGTTFGGRDHTTVMNGILKVENMLRTNDQLKGVINDLQKSLTNK